MDKKHRLKVSQLIFGERELLIVVHGLQPDEVHCYTVTELFLNDEILTEFSGFDIRLISFFAASEEYGADQKFIDKMKVKREKSPEC